MILVNGDSAAHTLKQAASIRASEMLVFRDVLSCGRLTPFNDLKSWAKIRRNFWADMYRKHGFGSVEEIEKAPHDFYNDFEALKKTEEISLWIGCAMSDQLLMVFTVKLFKHYGLDFNKLKIRQYRKFDSKRGLTVLGIGMLSPEQINAHKPEAFTLNEAQIADCLDVWQAVTATTPDKLMSILKQKEPNLPLLHKAMQNLFFRFPDIGKGLSRFDEIILTAAKSNAPNTMRIIGHTMRYDINLNDEESFHALDTVGDIYLFNRLKNMANKTLNKPLLKLNAPDKNFRETKTEVSDFGREVLEGKHNVVQVNGINDWVGGIHLDSSMGETWFRHGERLALKKIQTSSD